MLFAVFAAVLAAPVKVGIVAASTTPCPQSVLQEDALFACFPGPTAQLVSDHRARPKLSEGTSGRAFWPSLAELDGHKDNAFKGQVQRQAQLMVDESRKTVAAMNSPNK